MNPEPSLLIIAPLADDFDLLHLPWCDAARAKISVNHSKFKNLEMVEVIVDAMPFLLSRLTAAETTQQLAATKDGSHSSDLPSPTDSAITVVPRANLTSARHLSEVNNRLLLLGKWIGQSLQATAAAWMPSRKIVSFVNFDEMVRQSLDDGLFPTAFQTAFSETHDGRFVTSGLRYFTGQEIRLTAPPDYSPADTNERLMQIINSAVIGGRIEGSAQSRDLNDEETLIYTPSDDGEHVNIVIQPAKR